MIVKEEPPQEEPPQEEPLETNKLYIAWLDRQEHNMLKEVDGETRLKSDFGKYLVNAWNDDVVIKKLPRVIENIIHEGQASKEDIKEFAELAAQALNELENTKVFDVLNKYITSGDDKGRMGISPKQEAATDEHGEKLKDPKTGKTIFNTISENIKEIDVADLRQPKNVLDFAGAQHSELAYDSDDEGKMRESLLSKKLTLSKKDFFETIGKSKFSLENISSEKVGRLNFTLIYDDSATARKRLFAKAGFRHILVNTELSRTEKIKEGMFDIWGKKGIEEARKALKEEWPNMETSEGEAILVIQNMEDRKLIQETIDEIEESFNLKMPMKITAPLTNAHHQTREGQNSQKEVLDIINNELINKERLWELVKPQIKAGVANELLDPYRLDKVTLELIVTTLDKDGNVPSLKENPKSKKDIIVTFEPSLKIEPFAFISIKPKFEKTLLNRQAAARGMRAYGKEFAPYNKMREMAAKGVLHQFERLEDVVEELKQDVKKLG